MYIARTLLSTLATIVLLSQAWAQRSPSLASKATQQLIDSLRNALNRNYVYPEKAFEMSRLIVQKHRKQGYEPLKDPRELAGQLTSDVRSIYNDTHLSVRYDPDLEKRIKAFEATALKEPSDRENERRQNFFFQKAEVLKGNIGYIRFTNFADTNALSRKTVQAAFQFVAYTDALILDLRNNFGGKGEMAKEIAGYFFNGPRQTGRLFNRIRNTWTEDWVGNQPEITNGLHLTMSLYILTSERTFSAAEALAYNLKYLKDAVVVGDTTRGGAHATRSFALGNGFVCFIPFTRSENIVTKTDWEGTGVLPTVAITEEASLLKAQELILKAKLTSITDTTEKLKVIWLLNDLSAGASTIKLPEETLKQYTGIFEEFLFTLEDGKFYCRNTHQADKKDRLVAISERLFKIDEQSQVEFVTKNNGVVTAIRLLWDDGWVDTIEKTSKK